MEEAGDITCMNRWAVRARAALARDGWERSGSCGSGGSVVVAFMQPAVIAARQPRHLAACRPGSLSAPSHPFSSRLIAAASLLRFQVPCSPATPHFLRACLPAATPQPRHCCCGHRLRAPRSPAHSAGQRTAHTSTLHMHLWAGTLPTPYVTRVSASS